MRNGLYPIAQREFAEDLVFEINGRPVTLSIRGLLIAKAEREGYNFSFFEVTETETVLAVQMKGFIVYVAIESDEELDEDEYAEVGKALLEHLTPKIALLVTNAERAYSGKADLLFDDDMSPELKEFLYSLLIKHRRGENPYEQTEVA